jgi:amino acid adenylation domain-containing protein
MTADSQRHLDQLTLIASRHVKEGEYWLHRLSGDWVRRGFPFDRERGEPGGYEWGRVETVFPAELTEKVSALSKGTDVRLNMVLAAALAALLARYSGSGDVTVGMPIYRQEGMKKFINTVLVLRLEPGEEMTFKQLILACRQVILEAVEHQNYPLEVLAHRLERVSIPGRSPFFDVAMMLDTLHDRSYISHLRPPMLFVFSRDGDRLGCAVEYNTRLYLESTVSRVAGHFTALLEGALAGLDAALPHIEIITGKERRQIVEEFNNSGQEPLKDITLHGWFEQQVEKTPGNMAAAGAAFGENRSYRTDRTYKELNHRADKLACVLQQKGVGPDTIVAIKTGRSVDMLVGLLGILKAGGAYMPIDPNYPEGRIRFILEDSGAGLLVTDEADGVFGDWQGETVSIGAGENGAGGAVNRAGADTGSLAYVIYTSGTTGQPKGVLVEHRNVVAYMQAFFREFDIREKDVVLQLASYCFDVFTEEVYPVLLKGGGVVIPDDREAVDFAALLALIRQYGVSIIDTTPMLLREFNKMAAEAKDGDDYPLAGVRIIISGGDILKREHVSHLLGHASVYNTYGPTETTVCATFYRCSTDMPAGVPIGKPITNYNVLILDAASSVQLQPVGIAGELCISGEGVTRGYLNHPELTAQKYINKKFLGVRLYRTGDLARWMVDGNIEFLGRIDHQVKVRGFRIETGEIENRLLAMDTVLEAVVMVRKDRGEEGYLCAYVAPVRADGFSSAELREELSLQLPDFMIPAFFVRMERIPLTSHGKVDSGGLPRPEIRSEAPYVAPRDDVERGLARIWMVVFGLERVGIDDDFFDLGGHSLTGIQVTNEIHNEFDVAIQFTEVFQRRTIRELARYITLESDGKRYVSIEPVEKREYYPLSSAQKRLYVVQQMDRDSTAYNMAQGLPIEGGEPDTVLIEGILYRLMERHESLRTSFEAVNGEPVQRVHEAGDICLAIESHDPIMEDMEPPALRERIRAFFVRPFDLSVAPLLRVGLIRIKDQGYVLLLDMHHIISDARSNDVLIGDFLTLSHEGQLPPSRLQYRDFSHWQNLRRQEGKIKEQEEYWLRRFEGEIPVLKLATDFQRPSVLSFQGNIARFTIQREHLDLLVEMASAEKTTTFILFLALFNALLYKLCGQQDIVIGTPISGRGHPDLYPVMGMFVNTLALRHFPNGEMSFIECLRDVKKRTLEAFENQDYLFEDLVEKVAAQREMNRNPLFDIMFSHYESESGGGEEPASPEERLFGHETAAVKFDMTFDVTRKGNRFQLGIRYAADLFKEKTIKGFIDSFKTLVKAIVENPRVRLRDIELISRSDKEEKIADTFADLEDE